MRRGIARVQVDGDGVVAQPLEAQLRRKRQEAGERLGGGGGGSGGMAGVGAWHGWVWVRRVRVGERVHALSSGSNYGQTETVLSPV